MTSSEKNFFEDADGFFEDAEGAAPPTPCRWMPPRGTRCGSGPRAHAAYFGSSLNFEVDQW